MLTSLTRTARLLSASLALTSVLVAAADARTLDINSERLRPAFPRMELGNRHLAGQDAVDSLGARLGEVAGWYGKSADELRKQLLSDRRLRIDANGRMFAVEEMTAPLAATRATAQEPVLAGQLLPLDQTFQLHSRPGAKRTIFLDFDGATLTGTAWNRNSGSITAMPFDIDGTPGVFSNAERQRIQFIWQRVAEDYAPFDVDVTTQQPPADSLARTSATDQTYGTTVLITRTTGVYNCSCGGIAYIGVFNDTSSYYKPALVFYNMLGNGDEKATAEAISHETGHNLGLSHDGSSSSPYYSGQGSDPVTGWAPIMGVGYYKPVVQFSRGDYAGANNHEDDFAVAQSYGLPLRADDFGNSLAAAAALPASGTIDGVIERGSDVDMFYVAAGAGAFSASVKPANRSANADLSISLLNAAGNVVASASPTATLSAEISYQVPAAGTYYLRVRPTGLGSPTATGYSNYGSRGNYRVATRFQAGALSPTPVLTASASSVIAPAAVKLDASKSYDRDGTVKFYYWDFGDGTADRTGTLKTTTKTYSKAGSYVVRLTVVDNMGYRSSTARTISVGAAASAQTISVKSAILSLSLTSRGYRAKADVVVIDQAGAVVGNAAVSVKWTGVYTQSETGLTSSSGQTGFTTPSTISLGCYTLSITDIALAGYQVNRNSLLTRQVCT